MTTKRTGRPRGRPKAIVVPRGTPGLNRLLSAVDFSPTRIAKQIRGEQFPHAQQSTVRYWIRVGYVPEKFCPIVEERFGIPRQELNPAAFPSPEAIR
jgi:hypothetical protein